MLNSEDPALVMAVVEAGTLRGAAEAVHLSQPAISRRIQGLESRIKVNLFQRTGRRLRLTEAGEEFIRRSSDVLGRLQDLEAEMNAFGRGQRGVLRIGATATVCLYLLAPVLAEMRRRFPEYELFVLNESSRRMPQLVREGMADVGIASIGTPLPGLHVQPWKQLHLGLLGQGAAGDDAVSIAVLENAPLVMNSSGSLRDAVDLALRTHGVTPRVVAQADSLEVVRMLVACGFGQAVAPVEVMNEDASRSGLSLARFLEPIDPLPVACFYRRTLPPLRAFLELLGEG